MPIESMKVVHEPGFVRMNLRRLSFVVAGLCVGYLCKENSWDLAGDLHRRRTPTEIEIEVERSTRKLYEAADSAEKYELAYLRPEGWDKVIKVGTLEGGNGILGKIDTFFRGDSIAKLSHRIGELCLTESSYDIVRPEWSMRRESDAPAAKLVEFGNVLIVQPSNDDLPSIQFTYSVADATLVARDKITNQILIDNGCEVQ